jgi:hypothetical protein
VTRQLVQHTPFRHLSALNSLLFHETARLNRGLDSHARDVRSLAEHDASDERLAVIAEAEALARDEAALQTELSEVSTALAALQAQKQEVITSSPPRSLILQHL